MQKKKIAICHYRVGGTDGVSLEIVKRKEILEKLGCEVKLIAGPRSWEADYVIKELEWDNGVVPIIKENGFLYFDRHDLEDSEIKKKMKKISDAIKSKLAEIQKKEKFDAALIHNIFSFGGHIAAAKAFTKWIKRFNIPTLATHHDFYWERKEFQQTRNGYIKEYMEKFMPPRDKNIRHVVINSITRQELKRRHDLDSAVMPDTFDFSQPEWRKDSFNKDFLKQFDIKPNDLIILQATRIISRKGIEIAIDFAKELQKNISKLRDKIIYNGKKLCSRSNVVLIMAGYAEDEKREYLFKLKTKAFNEQVRAKFIGDNVKARRYFKEGVKTCSLWDAYVYADLVTFPSVWEGWGNQFIEAVFAKKPVVMFEYPVFKKDIVPEGYKVISLGDEIEGRDEGGLIKLPEKNIAQAADETVKWLLDKNTAKRIEHNFKIGKKYHDYKALKRFLTEKLGLD